MSARRKLFIVLSWIAVLAVVILTNQYLGVY